MPMKGDLGALRRVIADIEASGGRVMSKATDEVREEVDIQYEADFAAQRDPWGAAWAPTKAGKAPVLDRTGALRGARASGASGVIRLRPVKYWVYQQIGANGITPRAVLPFSDSNWNKPIEGRIDDVILDYFERNLP